MTKEILRNLVWEDNLACGKYLSNVANAIAHITQQNTA